jgi:hypothetical protein
MTKSSNFNRVGVSCAHVYENVISGTVYNISKIDNVYFIKIDSMYPIEEKRVFSTLDEFRTWNPELADIFEKDNMM